MNKPILLPSLYHKKINLIWVRFYFDERRYFTTLSGHEPEK